jgi:hypothetical protein
MRSARLSIAALVAIGILGPRPAPAGPIELQPGPMLFRLPTSEYRSAGFLFFHGLCGLFCPECWTPGVYFMGNCSLSGPSSLEGMAGCSSGPDASNLVVIWRLRSVVLPDVGATATIPVRLYAVRFPRTHFSVPCNASWALDIVAEESEGEMTIRRQTELGGSFDLDFELHAKLQFDWDFMGDFDPMFSYRVGPYSVSAIGVPWSCSKLAGEVPVSVCPDCVGDFAVGSGLLRGEGTTQESKRGSVYLDHDQFILPIAAACVIEGETGVVDATWSSVKALYR